MISKITNLWNNYSWEILLAFSLLFFLFYWFFYRRHKKTGTYSLYNQKFSLSDFSQPQYNNKTLHKKSPVRESKGEFTCRQVLQRLFNKPFPKKRPKFMFNNVTGSNLELDMYNSELRLAVEYNGQQHYNYTPYFHKTRDAFQNQKYRDKIKREICQKLGITLIEVPYTVPNDDIENYLIKELRKSGFKF